MTDSINTEREIVVAGWDGRSNPIHVFRDELNLPRHQQDTAGAARAAADREELDGFVPARHLPEVDWLALAKSYIAEQITDNDRQETPR